MTARSEPDAGERRGSAPPDSERRGLAPPEPVVVFGGYGVFGQHVAKDLVKRGITLRIAGRNRQRAEAFALELAHNCRGIEADVSGLESCLRALEGARVAVACAGPFSSFGTALLEACLTQGCHYVDIADDRRHVALVREYGPRFAERQLTAAFGCSSLPGISGALALHLRETMQEAPRRARVTLFIGNNNDKGAAAVTSCIEGLGRPIVAPQGTLRGFRDRVAVHLPLFGRRGVFNFDTPDFDLLPVLLDVKEIDVKVGFELRLATYSLAALAACGLQYGPRTVRLLRWLSRPFRRFGSTGGVVQVELFDGRGGCRRAALVAEADGQRMAALPCVRAVQHLLGNPSCAGATTACELLGHRNLLDSLQAEGYRLHVDP